MSPSALLIDVIRWLHPGRTATRSESKPGAVSRPQRIAELSDQVDRLCLLGRLATPRRAATRIALETRAVANEGKVPAFFTRFSFITLNARFGHKI